MPIESLGLTSHSTDRFVYVSADDPIAEPLLRELEQEYDARYGEFFGEKASAEITRYPASAFSADEGGAFVLLMRDGVAIAGGAYKRFDERTAELKRIWTSSAHRRQGLARRVVAELEAEAVRRGYTRAYLTTGPRQPEAKRLYFQTGYTPLFDTTLDPEEVVVHGFAKSLDGEPLDVAGITAAHDEGVGRVAARGTSRRIETASDGLDTAAGGLLDQRGGGGAAGGLLDQRRAVKVVPTRHWWRWVLSALVAFAVLQFAWSLVTNKQYEWNVFAEYFFSQSVLNSLGVTLGLTVVSVIGGFILGAVLANFRLSKSPLLSGAAYVYIWFFRSVPLLVQILVWYNLGYLYPTLGLGTPFTTDFWLVEFSTTTLITAFAAATIGLTLHQAAYFAEIIRGGILSVDQGQLEASAALGLPRRVRFFRIILPQAARAILPNFFNEVIGLVKGTSVVFVVALPELFYTVQVIYNRNQRVIPMLLVAVVWYAIITTVLSIIQFYVERHYARGAHRELPPTPIQRATAWVKQQWARLGDETGDDPLAAEKNRRHDTVLGSGS
ncbi:ABC transporter permease subunit [Agreia pratensis]